MLRFALAQLVLVELAAAAVAGGLALGGNYRYAGIAAAAVLVVLALGRRHGRWCYELLQSGLGFLRRRQARRQHGLAGALGGYQVVAVPGGGNAATIAAVRSGVTWCVPLLLGLDDVLNEDAGVPVRALTELLQVEDVALASVRLLNLITPGRAGPDDPGDPGVGALSQLASRYLLLSVDGARAADAVAARGGTRAAVHQILRRCVVHAEDVLGAAGVPVRRLDEVAVTALFATWLGPAAPTGGRRAAQAVERWSDVRVAGTRSIIVALTGSGPGVAERAQEAAASAPTPIAATCLALLPGRRAGQVTATVLLRVSEPDTGAAAGSLAALATSARRANLVLRPAGGEQVPLLRATMPVGLAGPPAAHRAAAASGPARDAFPALAGAAS